jgi:hypothetical protein
VAKQWQMHIDVECYSGYRGEETPRSISVRERRIAVEEMIDRWLAPDHRYFKFRGDDQGIYIIRHDMTALHWELVFFQDAKPRSRPAADETTGIT